MAGTPREYLTLAEVGEGTNYTKYAAGGARDGSDLYTHWSKLRIIPETLGVDRFDYTFSVSRGLLWYPPGPTNASTGFYYHWRYASAADCIGGGSTQGRANIDLRGTPFRVDPSVVFYIQGWPGPSGSTYISDDRKVANLQAGGYCGSDDASVAGGGTEVQYMRLSFDPSLVTPAVAPTIPSSGQPQSQTPRTGGAAVFSVTAIGTLPITYQWRFNGVTIANATNSSYGISAAGAADAGLYDVVVANSVGTNTSSAASLGLLDLNMLAGVYLTAPVGSHWEIDAAPQLAPTDWALVTNITIPAQPYIYVDYGSATNSKYFYRAVPH